MSVCHQNHASKENYPARTNTPENNPEGPGNPDIAQILELLRQQTANLAQQQQLLQQQQQQQPQPPVIPVVTFQAFQAVKPPEFKGSADPIEARSWLKEMEKAFTLVNVGEDLKTNFASYFLRNEATYWWESVKALEPA